MLQIDKPDTATEAAAATAEMRASLQANIPETIV